MQKRTKIIATVGPVTANKDMLISLYERGVNIIRFNFSHADHQVAWEIAERIHELNTSSCTSLSLLLDTKWPELRTGDLKENIHFSLWEKFFIYTDMSIQKIWEKYLTCDYSFLSEDVSLGWIVEIDSWLFHVRVQEKCEGRILVEALNSATIGSRRHVNLPGVKIRLHGITEKDKEDILFGIENGFDFIAASFVRTEENVIEIRKFLERNNASHIKIISKIENEEGMNNLESIVLASDGIMVARWDLGIEVPIEKVPRFQKQIIDLCRRNGKFVIVATHMLESMIEHPFPTRAEVSDIFRAVLQWADSTMLSGETTTWQYPLESVEMMTKVISEAEEELEHKHHEYNSLWLTLRDREKKYLIKSALEVAEELSLDTILVFTKSGILARLAAAYRPNKNIYAFTSNTHALGFMRILYGIRPFLLHSWSDHQSNLEDALRFLLHSWKITKDMRVIAVTDVMKNGKEIPAMEIIPVWDVL